MKYGYQLFKYITIFVVCVVFVAAAIIYVEFIRVPIIPAGVVVNYDLVPGTTLTTVTYDLQRLGYLRDPQVFIWLAKYKGASSRLQAGSYQFVGPLNANQLLEQLMVGKTRQARLTIIEGWTFADVMRAVNNSEALTHALAQATPADIMTALGHAHESPEGQFYPETYFFPVGTSDIEFLKRAYHTMQTHLQHAWQTRDAGLPYASSYEALIAASIIEKETAHTQEKPQVAGVLVRRLQKNMLLQFDPTVIYGLGAHYNGKLKRDDLQYDSPYNTYLYKGLPPTPIAMPGQSSLQAAVHPAQSNALYFVARGDGTHVFSDDFNTHQQAVNQYRQFRKMQAKKSKQQRSVVMLPMLNVTAQSISCEQVMHCQWLLPRWLCCVGRVVR